MTIGALILGFCLGFLSAESFMTKNKSAGWALTAVFFTLLSVAFCLKARDYYYAGPASAAQPESAR